MVLKEKKWLYQALSVGSTRLYSKILKCNYTKLLINDIG